jgi:hypothetical protein
MTSDETARVEAVNMRRLEAEREAAVRDERLRRRVIWLLGQRVAVSVALLVVSFFPIIEDTKKHEQHIIWEFVAVLGNDALGTFVGGWTLVTLLLVAAAVVTPGGRLGPLRQWATVGFLATFAVGHLLLAGRTSGQSHHQVFAAYWVIAGLALAAAAVWWARPDIDVQN